MGRESTELSGFLGSPLFWATWYFNQIDTEERDSSELIEPFFGVTDEEVIRFYEDHFSLDRARERRIIVRIPLLDGFSLGVEFAEDEDRYVLSNTAWDSEVVLGYHSGHFALPAFRWPEVARIGPFVASVAADAWHRRSGLLLFFPGVSITAEDNIDEVRSTLMREWEALGVVRRQRIGELVDQVIEKQTIEVRWWKDPALGWINDGEYSLRNPQTLMCPFDPEKFRASRSSWS